MNEYIERTLEPVLLRAADQFPAVVLTGPRQSGKTTLLKRLFGNSHQYVSLEPPDVRASASADPRGFLKLNAPPVILDEVQLAPDLLPYIKEIIDANRSQSGQFLLSGSQNLLMMSSITESLAGRSAILRLLPLSFKELLGSPHGLFPWQKGYKPGSGKVVDDIWSLFLRGGYPELAAKPDMDQRLWYSSYVQTYLERDIRQLRHVGDLTLFQSFVRALAARSGQLLSLTELSRDLGLAVTTVKQWLSVLEATYQVIVLRPYYRNIGKRMVKAPKVYFTDVGLLCYLVGLQDPQHAAAGPLSGAIVETAVISELVKSSLNNGEEPRVYFWRTSNGTEVDAVVEQDGRLIPIEIKQTATPRPPMASGLLSFMRDYPSEAESGWLVHLGDQTLPLAPGITALPIF